MVIYIFTMPLLHPTRPFAPVLRLLASFVRLLLRPATIKRKIELIAIGPFFF